MAPLGIHISSANDIYIGQQMDVFIEIPGQ